MGHASHRYGSVSSESGLSPHALDNLCSPIFTIIGIQGQNHQQFRTSVYQDHHVYLSPETEGWDHVVENVIWWTSWMKHDPGRPL